MSAIQRLLAAVKAGLAGGGYTVVGAQAVTRPWMMEQRGDKWCVFKKGEDGRPVGESLGDHATEEEARKQIAALYANAGSELKSEEGESETQRSGPALTATPAAAPAGQSPQPAIRRAAIPDSARRLHAPASLVVRTVDGGPPRWLMVAATAAVNRVGEIDSRALFDDFIKRAATRGYPYLTFHHQGPKLRMGEASFIARDGAVFIAAGKFDDTPLARAAAAGLAAKPELWGVSIGYMADSAPEVADVGGRHVPVYRTGWLEEISVLRQDVAASHFTVIAPVAAEMAPVAAEVQRMRDEIKRDLAALVGDDLAEEFAALVDTTERAIESSGLVVRAADAPLEVTPAAPAVDHAPPAAPVAGDVAGDAEPGFISIELDGDAIRDITRIIREDIEPTITDAAATAEAASMAAGNVETRLADVEARLTRLEGMLGTLEEVSETVRGMDARLGDRIDGLNAQIEEAERVARELQGDLPRRTDQATYRPRVARADMPPDSMAAIAANTLSNLPPRGQPSPTRRR